jgi:hypothetical protein
VPNEYADLKRELFDHRGPEKAAEDILSSAVVAKKQLSKERMTIKQCSSISAGGIILCLGKQDKSS